MKETEVRMYSVICRHDGIKAKDIAKETGLVHRTDINRILYGVPFIRELCYRDSDYRWHGLIRQERPHTGLADFCGYHASVERFMSQSEEEWLQELKEGCRSIGRNLNDKRGLFHSFCDSRQVMVNLFKDLESLSVASWEICFELRIKRARTIRIYADVLVVTEDKVFSLEFKMRDRIDPDDIRQAVKYENYIGIIFGEDYDVIPALVLTRAEDLYTWEQIPDTTAELPVCSGDMLFNLFDEFIGFLER